MSDSCYIWLEGVDFAQHIDDTNQIAVIRGSSIALLEVGNCIDGWLTKELAPDNITHEKIFTGASLTLFRVDCDEVRAREIASDIRLHLAGYGLIEKNNPHGTDLFKNPKFPFAYLRFVTGVAPVDPANQAGSIRLAHFRAREAQATGDYMPPAPPVAPQDAMCGMSRSRPADFSMPLTADQVERMSLEAKTDTYSDGTLKVSRSVAARRYYGRRARSRFFERKFSENKEKPDPLPYGFVNDLYELVTLGPGAEKVVLPIQVANKMAVFYADGNGFTKIREEKMGGDEKALIDFDKAVRGVLEGKFLKGLLNELYEKTKKSDGQTNDAVSTRFHSAAYNRADDEPGDNPDHGKPRLRFELLMYGGDEIAFIVPAWLGIEIAELFFDCVKDAKAGGHDLTFKAGLALVNHKMPIREARQLAHDLAEFARREEGGKPVNSITIQAFESVEPPANGLPQLHNSLWGTKADEGYDETLRDVVKLTPDELRRLSDMVLEMKRGGFARSQLYNMLKAAQWDVCLKDGKIMHLTETKLATALANKRAAEVFNAYKDRMPSDMANKLGDYLGDQKKAAMRAWLLTHVWDYVDAMEIAQDTGAGATGQAAAS
ncbi:MAG: hypothetical protein WA921_13685 [Ahrensia sp.]